MIAEKHRWVIVSIVYWVLLSYMIAALIWWFIALQNQNNNTAILLRNELKQDHPQYLEQIAKIEAARNRKTAQYIGEGATFLALILIGAVFVFRATRKQLRSKQQQQNFMMAVTHELKTPIAVTKLNLETLQRRKLTPEQQNKLINNTLSEADRLNTLCNNILLAAQLDAGKFATQQHELNFSELTESCVDEFANRFTDRTIHSHIEEGIYMIAEPMQLQMLINNLIDNALKYSPKNQPIQIQLVQQQQKALLSITDCGNGIPDDEKKRVFDKFYRTGQENTRNTKGTGLGLYLCKKIVKNHKGSITITNNVPNGCIFNVVFSAS